MLQSSAEDRARAMARIEAARADGTRIEHTVYNGFVIAFKKPTRAIAAWYRQAKADPDSALSADENLAKAILFEPETWAAVDAIVEEYPFALFNDDVSAALSRALGHRQAEEKKALPPPPTPNDSTPNPSPTA
jgi:hypothetical protein